MKRRAEFPLGVRRVLTTRAWLFGLGRSLPQCWIAGTYDGYHDDAHYKLLDSNDPTVGVSMTYRSGDACRKNNAVRTTTIDVYCDNVSPPYVEDATEPSYCQYHLIVRSTYGCPKECPVTKDGLCNGHGKCMYDTSRKESYCYCNKGYSGSSCTKDSGDGEESYDGYSVQLALTIVLLIITLALLGTLRQFHIAFAPASWFAHILLVLFADRRGRLFHLQALRLPPGDAVRAPGRERDDRARHLLRAQ